MKVTLKNYFNVLWKVILINAFVTYLWQGLEYLIYGEIIIETSDTIIGGLLVWSLYFNLATYLYIRERKILKEIDRMLTMESVPGEITYQLGPKYERLWIAKYRGLEYILFDSMDGFYTFYDTLKDFLKREKMTRRELFRDHVYYDVKEGTNV